MTDALATAFMLLSDEYIEQLCERSPGLEAWIVEDAPATSMIGCVITGWRWLPTLPPEGGAR